MKRESASVDEVEAKHSPALEDGDEDDDTDVSMIDVDFEFFDLNPKVDFHALNTLIKQLLGPDSIDFEIGSLVDLLLEKHLGSTVKVDGEESDPYAFLTVVDIFNSRNNPQLNLLLDYIRSKSKKDEKCYKLLSRLLSREKNGRVGLVLSERLINMPVEVTPPLYRIMLEELASRALTDPSYEFDHFILLSKSYTEITSKLDEEDDRPKKKGKSGKDSKETFYFHAEDEILISNATCRVQFQYSHELPESDSKRAFHDFGIKPSGELFVLSKAQLGKAIQDLQTSFPF